MIVTGYNFFSFFVDTQDVLPVEATFTSPKIKLDTPHCLSFYYYMVGANIGYLNVSVGVYFFHHL